jgi:hypothetical protein
LKKIREENGLTADSVDDVMEEFQEEVSFSLVFQSEFPLFILF